jgi:hypothetical protein
MPLPADAPQHISTIMQALRLPGMQLLCTQTSINRQTVYQAMIPPPCQLAGDSALAMAHFLYPSSMNEQMIE